MLLNKEPKLRYLLPDSAKDKEASIIATSLAPDGENPSWMIIGIKCIENISAAILVNKPNNIKIASNASKEAFMYINVTGAIKPI